VPAQTDEEKPVSVSEYTTSYLDEAVQIIQRLDRAQIDAMVRIIVGVRAGGGRLFFLGVGGSAGNCSHAVNDFRKIAGVESYAPTDNVSELTARINDDGWDTVFANWLLGSRIGAKDAVFVFSVGGGNLEKNVSPNLVRALELAQKVGAKIVGVVGRDGGHTAKVADACVVVPVINPGTITPHTEAFHAVVWHLIVTHPELKANEMKWESTQ
jgi:D-sedoheptulose 7-phosphate isomerase